MKTIAKFGLTALMAVCLALIAGRAGAQGTGFDAFSGVVSIQLGAGQFNTNTASTNAAPPTVDMIGITGVSKIDFVIVPDNAAGIDAGLVQVSNDNTNWNTMSNCAIAVNTALLFTNTYYSSSITITRTNLLPGTGVTTPTASSAGFATTYVPVLPLTNTASFKVTNSTVTEIGFDRNDQPRYVRLVVTGGGGTGTNVAWSGVLTGPRK